jgi:hypothetical protein
LALGKKIIIVKKTQQLILGTGTAIWWLTEPHCAKLRGFKIAELLFSSLKPTSLAQCE